MVVGVFVIAPFVGKQGFNEILKPIKSLLKRQTLALYAWVPHADAQIGIANALQAKQGSNLTERIGFCVPCKRERFVDVLTFRKEYRDHAVACVLDFEHCGVFIALGISNGERTAKVARRRAVVECDGGILGTCYMKFDATDGMPPMGLDCCPLNSCSCRIEG